MIAEKANHFQDHRAVELIMSSTHPSTHKRIGRGVLNFASAVGDKKNQTAVLSGTYDKFTRNPAMKNHLLSSGNKLLAEYSPLDSVLDFWSPGG